MIPGFPEDQAEETFKETSGGALGKGLADGGAACGLNRGLGPRKERARGTAWAAGYGARERDGAVGQRHCQDLLPPQV